MLVKKNYHFKLGHSISGFELKNKYKYLWVEAKVNQSYVYLDMFNICKMIYLINGFGVTLIENKPIPAVHTAPYNEIEIWNHSL